MNDRDFNEVLDARRKRAYVEREIIKVDPDLPLVTDALDAYRRKVPEMLDVVLELYAREVRQVLKALRETQVEQLRRSLRPLLYALNELVWAHVREAMEVLRRESALELSLAVPRPSAPVLTRPVAPVAPTREMVATPASQDESILRKVADHPLLIITARLVTIIGGIKILAGPGTGNHYILAWFLEQLFHALEFLHQYFS